MIKIILILIIIILLSVIVSKERFSSNFVDDKDCNFVPWGDNKKKCITNCRYSPLSKYYDKMRQKCDEDSCNSICDKCTTKMCQWNDIDTQIPDTSPVNNLTLTGEKDRNQIILNWKFKDSVNLKDSDITNYFIHYRESGSHPLHIIKLPINNLSKKYTFEIKDTNDYKYIPTKNLKENKSYEFIVYGILITDETDTINSQKLNITTS